MVCSDSLSAISSFRSADRGTTKFLILVDVSDIFNLFSARGREGKGEPEAPGRGGGRFFIEPSQEGGGVFQERWAGGEGPGG